MSSTSPFKFLDAYNKADHAIFFGRVEEIEKLYEMAHQTNLTLVYGQSGTGKTSLIQCGLANRFQSSDWFDVYIRRNDEINQSLLQGLKKLDSGKKTSQGTLLERLQKHRKEVRATTGIEETEGLSPVIKALRSLHKHYLKPIYLIFDQFEELFILGSQEEQEIFYHTVADVLQSEGYCRMIFVLREEAIAQLYDFEKVVPTLFDKRLRVEPMGRTRTMEVVKQTCRKFGIKLDGLNVPESIIEAISGGKGRVELTYLQVFMDRLYQLATENGSEEGHFSEPLVNRLGNIEDVLAEFLRDQSLEIQTDLERALPPVPHRGLNFVLNAFVTLEGTKQSLTRAQIRIPQLTAEQTDFCLERLEKGRIIRYAEDRYELAHDALAKQIADQRSAEDIAFLEVNKLIQDRFRIFKSTNTYLNHSELALIGNYRKRLEEENKLSEAEWKYIKKSDQEDKRIRKRRRMIVTGVIAVLSVLVLASGFLFVTAQRNLTAFKEEQKRNAEAKYAARMAQGEQAMASSNYERAKEEFLIALEHKTDDSLALNKISEAEIKLRNKAEFERNITQGDSLYALGESYYVDAWNQYKEALNLDYNNPVAQGKIGTVEGKLETLYSKWISNGDNFMITHNRSGYSNALRNYERANRFRSTPELRQKIAECEKALGQN